MPGSRLPSACSCCISRTYSSSTTPSSSLLWSDVAVLGGGRGQVEAQGVGVVASQKVGPLDRGATALAELCPLEVEVLMVTMDKIPLL